MSGLEVLRAVGGPHPELRDGGRAPPLGAWRVHWARVEPAKVERWWAAFERVRVSAWQRARVVAGGASESLAVVEAGASEMWRMGASERWSIGASEWLAMGGSEVARLGASEWLYGGASALLYGGASGMGWGGASERVWGGASEWLYGGGSGWSPGGASEHVPGEHGDRRERGVCGVGREDGEGGAVMARGYLALVLHAHLPFVRHPEAPAYMEEEWFFEAITETYVPLLLAFERLSTGRHRLPPHALASARRSCRC